MKLKNFFAGFIFAALLSGCISMPKIPALTATPPPSSAPVEPVKPTIVQKIFEPAKARAIEQATASPAPVAVPVKIVSESSAAVKHVVTTEVVIFWIAGIAGIAFGSFLIYTGSYIPGVKFIWAGLLLPIFATWFAYHYILIIALVLVASAIGFLWAERNSTAEKELLAAISDEYKKLYAELLKKIIVAPVMAPAAVAPNSVTVKQ